MHFVPSLVAGFSPTMFATGPTPADCFAVGFRGDVHRRLRSLGMEIMPWDYTESGDESMRQNLKRTVAPQIKTVQ